MGLSARAPAGGGGRAGSGVGRTGGGVGWTGGGWRRLAAGIPARPSVVAGLAVVSLAAALVAARVAAPGGPWLWNLDLPKIQYPWASLLHDALVAGHLPLWDDRLGLGFPLYAEGQIGAFYPPDWLIFRLDPLVALDVTRVLHLALAGTGAGLLALRLTGSRTGVVVAALVAVLGGAIATKLEWQNMVAAYGWAPWVLVPLARRPSPTRGGVAVAGILWGVQALAGHPNTWFLTGLSAVVLMAATSPRRATVGRIVAFGLIGVGVGAVQLVPTAILTTLSVRSAGLSETDLFASAATPFDLLGFGFANPFVQAGSDGTWDLATAWYPDGAFALLEAGAFVGLPVIALAAVGASGRRVRPLLAVAAVMLAIPVIAAFHPPLWASIPVLDGLRSPVRAYVLVGLVLGVLAGAGVARLGRTSEARGGIAAASVGIVVSAYLLTGLLAQVAPGAFDQLLLWSSSFLGPDQVEDRRRLAQAALAAPWPFTAEAAFGIAAVAVVLVAGRLPSARVSVRRAAVVVAALPLLLFGHAPNPVRPVTDFSFADQPLVRALASLDPGRVLTLDPPGWYAGMPDQLAAAGIPDVRMFSSLDLEASDELVASLERDAAAGILRRAVGIDTVVTFGTACPGTEVARLTADSASICRVDGVLRPPYWIPAADAVPSGPAGGGSLISPVDATVDVAAATRDARPASTTAMTPGTLDATIVAPADGWVWVDRSWWPAWRTTVDGVTITPRRALGGQLIPVGAGSHRIEAALVPWDALLGLLLGVVALAAAVAWARWPWARRPRPSA